MTANEYLKKLDWDSAIAAATLEIEKNKSAPPPPEQYLYRGIAHCFKPDKEGKHTKAIEDLSTAISLGVCPAATAYYCRAFANYLDGSYERALADIKHCKGPEQNELRGKIYTALNKYEDAATAFGKAVTSHSKESKMPPPSLLEAYIEACNKMNSV